MRRNRVFDFWFRKQYIIAGAMVLVAAFGMTALYSHNQEQERIRLEQELAQREKAEQLAKEQKEAVVEKASSVIPPKEVIEERVESNKELFFVDEATYEVAQGDEQEALTDESEKESEDTAVNDVQQEQAVQDVAVTTPNLHFPIEEGMLWPMDGNVIMNYSMDATIYYATLDQYKYNPAIIIAGDVNNKVYAVARGQITDISQNEVTGTTVTVDLGDGFQAIYGQLKELNFKKGDYVESGHVIGYVSEPTKYYSVEGSNLYFELQKDGIPVDPIVYFE